jgi:hypothetical protein
MATCEKEYGNGRLVDVTCLAWSGTIEDGPLGGVGILFGGTVAILRLGKVTVQSGEHWTAFDQV